MTDKNERPMDTIMSFFFMPFQRRMDEIWEVNRFFLEQYTNAQTEMFDKGYLDTKLPLLDIQRAADSLGLSVLDLIKAIWNDSKAHHWGLVASTLPWSESLLELSIEHYRQRCVQARANAKLQEWLKGLGESVLEGMLENVLQRMKNDGVTQISGWKLDSTLPIDVKDFADWLSFRSDMYSTGPAPKKDCMVEFLGMDFAIQSGMSETLKEDHYSNMFEPDVQVIQHPSGFEYLLYNKEAPDWVALHREMTGS